jgi:hypothetical protein
MNTIASQNPLTKQNYYHSSSSYETKYGNTTSNPSNYDREQYHSQESSPSATTTTNTNRSPSPVTGYNSSSTYVPQYDYRNVSFLFYIL